MISRYVIKVMREMRDEKEKAELPWSSQLTDQRLNLIFLLLAINY
jgi:hypothetical protein